MGSVHKRIKQIICVANHQYVEWMLNGKQIIVFVILFFLMRYVSVPLVALSESVGIPLQWTETFHATVNSAYMIPIFCFCFITLMSEFPKRNYEDTNIFFRTKRSTWYYGQILFSVYAIITYLVEIVVLFLTKIASVAYTGNGWSPIMKTYMEKYLEVGRGYNVVAIVPSEVYNHFAPNEAFFYTLLLLAGMFMGMNLIMFLFNLLEKKSVGIVINIVLIVIGIGMIYMKSDYLKYLPIGNVVLQCQNRPATRLTEWYEPLLYFLISNIIFIIIGRFRVRKVCL